MAVPPATPPLVSLVDGAIRRLLVALVVLTWNDATHYDLDPNIWPPRNEPRVPTPRSESVRVSASSPRLSDRAVLPHLSSPRPSSHCARRRGVA